MKHCDLTFRLDLYSGYTVSGGYYKLERRVFVDLVSGVSLSLAVLHTYTQYILGFLN